MENTKKKERRKKSPTMFESEMVLLPQQIFSTLDSFCGSDIYMKMGSRMAGSQHLKSLFLLLSLFCPYEATPRASSRVRSSRGVWLSEHPLGGTRLNTHSQGYFGEISMIRKLNATDKPRNFANKGPLPLLLCQQKSIYSKLWFFQ